MAQQKTRKLASSDIKAQAMEEVARGLGLFKAGQYQAALASYNKAIKMDPSCGEAFNSKGAIYHYQNNFKEAEKFFRKAIQCQENAAYYVNLGRVLAILHRYDESLEVLNKSVNLAPNNHEVYGAIGGVLIQVNQTLKSLWFFQQAILLCPENVNYKRGLNTAIRTIVFHKFNPVAKDLIVKCLEEERLNHTYLFHAWFSLLKHDPSKKHLMNLMQAKDYEEFKQVVDLDLVKEEVNDPFVLLALCRLIPNRPDVEILLRNFRRWILLEQKQQELYVFTCALAVQCFFNEYIYFESDNEKSCIKDLREEIEAAKVFDDTLKYKIAIFATYHPLYMLKNAEDVMQSYKDDTDLAFADIMRNQIAEPLQEEKLKSNISSIGKIQNDISQKVRDQYENNPYPRWKTNDLLEANMHIKAKSEKLSVLVAGCGTGQEPINAACKLGRADILGVDLSLSSLAYASRKAKELGVDNITFRQGDILDLEALDQKFDLINCSGVLHHMEDPVAGWRVLTNILKDNGRMKIGLYSETARQKSQYVWAQNYIKEHGYERTPDSIKAFREHIFGLPESDPARIASNTRDFYDLSSCRDLLFHVQEHRFTLPQIGGILDDLGLEFLGMKISFPEQKVNYQTKYPNDSKMDSLERWAAVEKDNPHMFQSMYVLWMCKKGQVDKTSPASWVQDLNLF